MKQWIFILSILLIAHNASADNLKPFKSDGCSAFPDGTFSQNKLWLNCCQQHDYDYWKGGTYQQRLTSDKALKACVAKVGEPEIALLMLAGVRVGGTPFLPTQFRWGYGWSYPRFYGALSEPELEQVKNLKPK
ncbi:MAG: FAD-binding oxidoreductase [Cellvibrionaceae bacterium]